MTHFTRRPLQLLDGIYQFVGGLKGVRGVDLGSEITLVHDVSRQGERAGTGGYFGLIHARGAMTQGAGIGEDFLTREGDFQPVLGLTDELYELYILRVWGNCTSGDVGDVTSWSWHYGVDGSSGSAPLQMHLVGSAANWYDLITQVAGTALGNVATSTGTARGGYGYTPPSPIRVPPGGFIGVSAEHTASAILQWGFECWAGPVGSTPPGMS